MSSTKLVLCDLCILLIFSVSLVFTEEKDNGTSMPEEELKGNCTCGGFPSEKTAGDSIPLLSQSPGLVVKCDEGGEITCKSLCVALATAAKAKGPEIICSRLTSANELKLSAFYKVCDKPWTFAGMTAEIPLCCEDSKPKVCPSLADSKGPIALDSKTVM